MSLFGALNIGQSALAAQQAALQVTGNNVANSADPNYIRETATITPNSDQQITPGVFMGTGVDLTAVTRQVDQNLEARLRGANSDSSSASTVQTFLGQVESTFNALGTNNLSTQMGQFFSSWSNLANNPQDPGLRQVVLQDGQSLAESLNSEQTQLNGITTSVQQQISADVSSANGYAQQIANLNAQIVTSQGGAAGTNNSLQDQRDAVLSKLAGLVNITTEQQSDGAVNVYIGSQPLVMAGANNGLAAQTQMVNGQTVASVTLKSNNSPLALNSGALGALQTVQTQVSGVSSQVNTLAGNLIFEVNKLHASGQGTDGITGATSTNAVSSAAAPLNSAAAGLPFTPTNGSFVVHVTDATTGLSTSSLVQVNLTGSPNDTTLTSLAASLNGINGVSATITNGKLTIASTTPGATITFSQDSSNTLAALGINTFFTGKDAGTIAVNQTVVTDPNLIAAAKNGDSGDNQTALAIANLNTAPVAALNGQSLQDTYQSTIDAVAGQVANANTNVEATTAVQQALTAQQESISGVSLDEESVNMITQQRAYQGAALFITTLNNMMTTLLGMIA